MAEGTSGKLRRRVKSETRSLQSEEKSEEESKFEDSQNIVQDPSFNKEQRKKWLVGSYWLTRTVFIRALGSIYCKSAVCYCVVRPEQIFTFTLFSCCISDSSSSK